MSPSSVLLIHAFLVLQCAIVAFSTLNFDFDVTNLMPTTLISAETKLADIKDYYETCVDVQQYFLEWKTPSECAALSDPSLEYTYIFPFGLGKTEDQLFYLNMEANLDGNSLYKDVVDKLYCEYKALGLITEDNNNVQIFKYWTLLTNKNSAYSFDLTRDFFDCKQTTYAVDSPLNLVYEKGSETKCTPFRVFSFHQCLLSLYGITRGYKTGADPALCDQKKKKHLIPYQFP